MKKYLVKIRCNGKNPCVAFRKVEANNPTEAIVSVNNYHNEIGARDRRTIVAVYEQVWNIDPDKM
jgi:hypothetical protein